MKHSINITAGFFLALLLAPFSLQAQSDNDQKFGPWVWGVQGGAVQQFETDMSNKDGAFSVSRYFIQPSLGYAWDRRNSVSLSFGVGESNYDFSSDARIEGLEPWDRIREYQLSLPIRLSTGENSNAIIIPSVRINAESGADLSDGRTEGVLAGLSWKLSDTLTIGPGFGWFSELGGGSSAFPIIVVDWDITEKLALTTGPGLASSRGPGLGLNYALRDKWTLGLSARYEKVRFALDDEGSSKGSFGEDKSLPLVFSVKHSPWPMTSLSAFVSSDFAGDLTLEDSKTRELASSEYDTAFSLGLVFSSRF